ncbi:hypothetical protein HW450_03310 [Corynebacterium hindlerae]|uniref:DUF3329 domain-containing protein n=1 Tax=Corynebacterium hindlerae TaxID=699041 RepID=A0A7G5FGN5_9CORY|nr:gephyrin-like molybdotransferase receptor GlpR [Corynebacterium hindlerae]QMV85776.1 hypothetical protein HW450_03310 [Corynebacterium hindlerae]
MSGTLPIVLIVVVWLFVLAPIALRGRKPIRHTNEAFEETRVIHSGGDEVSLQRRKPRLSSKDVHASDLDDEDMELVEVDDVLIDDEDERTGHLSDRIGQAFGRFGRNKTAERVDNMDVVEGSVVAELPAPEPAESELEEDSYDEDYLDDEGEYYDYDEAYLSPADYLHDDATYEPVDELESANYDVEDGGNDEELSEADLEFAAKRRGRGGYDPEADALATANRFQRRQRTLIGLVSVLVLSVIVSAVVGGWVWIAPAVVLALTAFYLYVLRQQVQQEHQLRARRIRHMRRARLGVRSAEGVELGLPPRLRRPGAVVLELDDESPDFAYLPETTAHFAPEQDHDSTPEPRRVS